MGALRADGSPGSENGVLRNGKSLQESMHSRRHFRRQQMEKLLKTGWKEKGIQNRQNGMLKVLYLKIILLT
jgi:hypothetical protein